MTETVGPGTVFAGYLIERVLGTGGMGSVYLARHPRLPRRDALKVLSQAHSDDDEYRARFIREAELAARLDHPNIVAVHDRGVTYGRLWIAMQFVDGVDAAELIRHDAVELPPERALHIIGEAASGLDAAHRAGLLHRDVKPANIMLEFRPGQPDRVFVADFGIAKAAGQATALTSVGSVLATLAYAAPEQLMAGVVDHRADVYALGCTLYELLTRVKPFPRATAVAVMQAHIQDPPPRVTAVNPVLPQAIDDVIARAMAKNPDHRYHSCGALADAAVAAFRGGVADERTVPVPPRVGRSRGRFILAGVAAVAAIAAVAAVGVIALHGNSTKGAPSSGVAAPTTSAATMTTSTAAATGTPAKGALSWGSFAFIPQAFPEILPESPVTSGYQGIRCVTTNGNDDPVSVTDPVPDISGMSCTGNRNPVTSIFVGCNSNRHPTNLQPFRDVVVVGDERWERSSGRGRIVWSNGTTADNDPNGASQPEGILQIQFDSPTRNFCQLQVYGGSSGQDLYDRWWRGAPF